VDAKNGKNGKNGLSEGIHDVNMTPLIDVSLVLVVILMVATPLAFQSSIAVNAATASGQKAVESGRSERIEIDVRADNTVDVNRQRIPRESLGAVLRPLIEQSTTRLVIVRCEPDVAHGEFVSVLDDARTAGATHIGVVGR
jgi:biopolymer transport protein ExbD